MVTIEYLIAGVVIGLCFFIVPIWAYRRGMKDMKAIMEGKMPEPIQTPVKAITKAVEERQDAKKAKEEQDVFLQGLNNIMSYDGSPQEVKHD